MLAQLCCIKLQEAELRNTARAGVQSCKDVPHLVFEEARGRRLTEISERQQRKSGKRLWELKHDARTPPQILLIWNLYGRQNST